MSEFKDEQRSQLNQKEEPSIADQLKEFYSKKIDEGFQVKDRATAIELRKMGQDELKLDVGWNAHAKKILSKVLKEKGLILADEPIKARIGNLIISTPPPEKIIEEQQQLGTLPIEETKTASLIPLDPSIEKANQETIKEGFKFVGQIYSYFGLIEGEGETKQEPITREKFEEEATKYAERVGTFCYRRNIQIPWLIEVLSLVGTAVILFGMPVIKVLFFKTEMTKQDDESRTDGKDTPEP
ncbi:MAG: hypothetical protein ACRD9Q_04955 [Nitrososphaeraceae archaeon]